MFWHIHDERKTSQKQILTYNIQYIYTINMLITFSLRFESCYDILLYSKNRIIVLLNLNICSLKSFRQRNGF